MIVFGIDPGTHITGYGVILKERERLSCLDYGEIKIGRGEPLTHCLGILYDRILSLVQKVKPQALALEDIFYGRNVKSLIKQGHARGAIMLVSSHTGIPLFEYTPLEVKKATVGYGRAEKQQVQHMVKVLLGLPSLPPTDAADALAISICHANFLKSVPS
ncbi:MAG: crossover junction endodeoxyribonuclease RuvC [Deltaproteobacteria bacterium]|nr:crossover junction endodeoxyribonuclease RuvC [Deltaproteobacteria bacterium]